MPTRSDFPFSLIIPTRWGDNDALGHVNNVIYNRFFEAVVVRFVMEEGGLDWFKDQVFPLAVETLCRFHRPLSYPDVIDGRLRVSRLGNSSAKYEIALFTDGIDDPAASGHFVHVFVDRHSSAPAPIPDVLRSRIEKFT